MATNSTTNVSKKRSYDAINEQMKPSCKYGEKCYRKNAEHLREFSHLQRKKKIVDFL